MLGCSSDSVELDCAAHAAVQACDTDLDPLLDLGCACSGGVLRDSAKSMLNDCGTQSDCGAIEACIETAVSSGSTELSPLLDENHAACKAYYQRCEMENDPCDLIATYSGFVEDEWLQGGIHCYEIAACLEGALLICANAQDMPDECAAE